MGDKNQKEKDKKDKRKVATANAKTKAAEVAAQENDKKVKKPSR